MPRIPGTLVCTLQDENDDTDQPRLVAEEIVHGGQPMLLLTAYHLRDSKDPAPDDGPELSDVVRLPREAWETLVTLFALRYPEAAAQIVARAQGWNGGHS